jgi:hypothetical protein
LISMTKSLRILTIASVLASGLPAFGAVTITMGSPGKNTSWAAGANCTCFGNITWKTSAPADPRPTGVAVYLHQGGNAGVITNSGFTNPNNVDDTTDPGTEDWSLNITLTPTNPPAGGGNGAYAVYDMEAAPTVHSIPIPDGQGNYIRTDNNINLQNG